MPRRKGGSGEAGAPPKAASPASSHPGDAPWRLRFSPRILDEDLPEIGHAAYQTARRAIDKTLRVDPHACGAGLRPPLAGLYKLKSSHVRIAYHIEDAAHEVWILMIADRRTIWDRHETEILARLGRLREDRSRRQKGGR